MSPELESVTRAQRVDRQLAKAGWTRASRRVVDEFFLSGDRAVRADDGASVKDAFIDNALVLPDGRPIAIVEVKRNLREALEGECQSAGYADRVKLKYGIDPFIFLTNGDEIWFWHRSLYPPRLVSGFFTQDDLERLAFIDRFHEPPSLAEVNSRIVDRAFQIEGVKTVAERIELGYRRFLLVLATGTGKTRVAIALVDLLRRQKWTQRVLFLADRRELVKQAIGAFKEHLPDAPCCWIEGGIIDPDATIHAATYPGMMGLFRQLSPGYYDLIICDESHRSVYHRYKAILDHFDAIHLGLTATPTDFIDRNTFELFDCENGLPTLSYSYDEAVRDRHLVPYRPVHIARTGFQLAGVKPGELPAEVREQVQAQGADPDDFSFEGTDLERKVSNTGTNDSIVREFMEHFWQMIGRGTRKWTDPVSGQEKGDFLIIDHWDSFAYFQVNKDGRVGSVTEPLPTRLFRLRLEKLGILAGRGREPESGKARASLQTMLAALPLENVNVAPQAEEIRALIDDPAVWRPLDQTWIDHLSHHIAPLLRYADTGSWAELQFENQTEQLALAHLKADQDEVQTLSGRIIEGLRLLPKDLPEVRRHLQDLAFALSPAFWQHLDYQRIMDLHDRFAPLMRFRSRRPRSAIIQLDVTDRMAQRHWLVYGPGGEGTFAENYRLQVEAMVRRLAEQSPALKRLCAGHDLGEDDLAAIESLLSGPDLFISEARLRDAYEQPTASLADFLRHILGQTRLPSREAAISEAFDAWVARHPQLGVTQLLFIRTLRHALIQHAEVATLEGLRRPPFNSIGDPQQLFAPDDLEEILELAMALAA